MNSQKKYGKNKRRKSYLIEIIAFPLSICATIVLSPRIISLIREMAKDGVTAKGVFNTAVLSFFALMAPLLMILKALSFIEPVINRMHLKRAEREEQKKKPLI